jgi:hypothetical protein
MYVQLRTYTVNRGKMDEWVRWFADKLIPVAKQAGQTIQGPWVNEAKTEFVWMRVYDSAEDAKVKDERFYSSAGWKAIAPESAAFIAKTEVKVLTTAQVPAKVG